jgi:hypothetical protein
MQAAARAAEHGHSCRGVFVVFSGVFAKTHVILKPVHWLKRIPRPPRRGHLSASSHQNNAALDPCAASANSTANTPASTPLALVSSRTTAGTGLSD